jgi:nitrous oxidase accessory protein NosD
MNTHRQRSTTRISLGLAVAAGATAGLVGGAPMATAAAGTPLTCGTVVTTDVRLTADLLDCAGSGLVVGAPGITIDLAGHLIDGTGSGSGIDNVAGHDDVRITRGTLREFLFGVELFETTATRVERVAAHSNAIGVTVHRSEDVELDRVTATDNTSNGIEVGFSDGVVVRRSTAADNGLFGIVDRFSWDSTYERNTVAGNLASGLTLDRIGGDVVVEHNRAVANDSDGIVLTAIGTAVVERNDAIANNGNGISADEPGNILGRNHAVGNYGIGIAAPGGTIDNGRNHARGNAGGDCTAVVCR